MTKIKYILFFFLSIVLFIVIFEFISAITMKFVIGKRTRDYQERMVISELYKDMDLETYRQDYKYFIHNFLYLYMLVYFDMFISKPIDARQNNVCDPP